MVDVPKSMDRRLKIALVSPYDYPYPGGVTEHIAALDAHLRALGHDTRILAASSKDADTLNDHVIKVSGAIQPVTVGGATARVAYSPQVFRRVKKMLREEKFDVVHVHEPTVPMLSIAVLRYSNAINVGTFHAYRESHSAYDLMRPLLLQVLRRLDGRIFVSDVAHDFTTRYFPGESVIIPNGIDSARFAARELLPLPSWNDGRHNILFVGRMDERKGFRHLLRAFPYIQKQVPGARLLVVGAFDENAIAQYRRYTRTHNLKDVHFIGRVSAEELPRYYRTATLFCAPSTGSESFGLVLLEAMAAGVPIIASDIPGYRGLLEGEHVGLLVPQGNEHELARAAVALLQDPARRDQMSARGGRIAREYDWDVLVHRVVDYYRQLITAHQPERAMKSGRRDARFIRAGHFLIWGRLRRSLRVMGL